MASARIEKGAYELARQAASIEAESIVEYISRVVRERAEADLLESARKRLESAGDAKSGKSPPKK